MELSNMSDRAKDCFMEAVIKRCEDIINWPFLLDDNGTVDLTMMEQQEARIEDLTGFGQKHHITGFNRMKVKKGRREGGGRYFRAKHLNGPPRPQQQGCLLEQVKQYKVKHKPVSA